MRLWFALFLHENYTRHHFNFSIHRSYKLRVLVSEPCLLPESDLFSGKTCTGLVLTQSWSRESSVFAAFELFRSKLLRTALIGTSWPGELVSKKASVVWPKVDMAFAAQITTTWRTFRCRNCMSNFYRCTMPINKSNGFFELIQKTLVFTAAFDTKDTAHRHFRLSLSLMSCFGSLRTKKVVMIDLWA